MIKISMLLFVAVLGFSLKASNNDYRCLNAKNKQAFLWEKILNDEWQTLPDLDGKSWKSILSNLKSLATLRQTFSHDSDEMPLGRIKFIHSYGAVAKVSFISENNHKYTGVFKTGATGLIRFSLAGDPKYLGFVPGIAIKFLIDAKSSLNIQAMNSLEGQGNNKDWFAKSFSNHIKAPESMMLKALSWLFSWVSNPPNILSVRHLASIDASGQIIVGPITPDKIEFVPSQEVKGLIAEDSTNDFRKDLQYLKPGMIIYSVYTNCREQRVLLGSIRLDSYLISSKYGDKHLFFQHHR